MKRFILPLLLVFLFTGCKFIEEKGWFSKEEKVDTLEAYYLELEQARRADSIMHAMEMEQARARAIEDSIRLANEQAMARPSGRYHIIVGSFKNANYADSYSDKINGLGYSTQILYASNGFHLVSTTSAETFSGAVNQLGTYRNSITENAWIYIER